LQDVLKSKFVISDIIQEISLSTAFHLISSGYIVVCVHRRF